MQKLTKQQKEETKNSSIKYLQKYIDRKKGIVIIIKSVSKSGMSRKMSVYTQKLELITYDVAQALGWSYRDGYITVNGCGMDMTFHLAYSLSHVLYSDKEQKKLTGNGSGCLPWKTL